MKKVGGEGEQGADQLCLAGGAAGAMVVIGLICAPCAPPFGDVLLVITR